LAKLRVSFTIRFGSVDPESSIFFTLPIRMPFNRTGVAPSVMAIESGKYVNTSALLRNNGLTPDIRMISAARISSANIAMTPTLS
jgi:hypothetical protein